MYSPIPHFIHNLITVRGYVPVKIRGINTAVKMLSGHVITYAYKNHALIKTIRDLSDGSTITEEIKV